MGPGPDFVKTETPGIRGRKPDAVSVVDIPTTTNIAGPPCSPQPPPWPYGANRMTTSCGSSCLRLAFPKRLCALPPLPAYTHGTRPRSPLFSQVQSEIGRLPSSIVEKRVPSIRDPLYVEVLNIKNRPIASGQPRNPKLYTLKPEPLAFRIASRSVIMPEECAHVDNAGAGTEVEKIFDLP